MSEPRRDVPTKLTRRDETETFQIRSRDRDFETETTSLPQSQPHETIDGEARISKTEQTGSRSSILDLLSSHLISGLHTMQSLDYYVAHCGASAINCCSSSYLKDCSCSFLACCNLYSLSPFLSASYYCAGAHFPMCCWLSWKRRKN